MIYVKGVLAGFAAVLLGCLVTPIGLMIRAGWKANGAATISFSPMGLANHLAHSMAFRAFILVLSFAGFVSSLFFSKR